MKGQDILKALNDIDIEMIEAAGNCGSIKREKSESKNRKSEHKQNFRYQKLGFAVAVTAVFAIFVTCFYQRIEYDSKVDYIQDVPYQITYVESTNTYLFSDVKPYTLNSLVRDNSTENSTETIQISEEFYEDNWTPFRGKAIYSSRLKKAISEGHERIDSGEICAEQLYYLVEIVIQVPLTDYYYSGGFDFADEEIKEAEYKRLTEECGLDLIWIAPGGYDIPNAYTYCLGSGIIYGALTEEQLENFPVNSEYSYGLRLTSYDAYSFAEYPYKEIVTEEEYQKHLEIALDALDEALSKDE